MDTLATIAFVREGASSRFASSRNHRECVQGPSPSFDRFAVFGGSG